MEKAFVEHGRWNRVKEWKDSHATPRHDKTQRSPIAETTG